MADKVGNSDGISPTHLKTLRVPIVVSSFVRRYSEVLNEHLAIIQG